MRKEIFNEIYKLSLRDDRVVLISTDTGKKDFIDFYKHNKKSLFVEGVFEQATIGFASGLAMCGLVPFISNIASFLTRRSYEQIYLNAGYHNLPIRLIGSGGGGVYAPLGNTHLSYDDISLMANIPNMRIFTPCDASEVRKIINKTKFINSPIYIRLGKGNETNIYRDKSNIQKYGTVLFEGGYDLLILSYGVMTHEAINIKSNMKNLGVSVLHFNQLKPINYKYILNILKKYKNFIILEEQIYNSGLFKILFSNNLLFKYTSKLINIYGFPDKYISGYGSQSFLMSKYKIDSKSVIKSLNKFYE